MIKLEMIPLLFKRLPKKQRNILYLALVFLSLVLLERLVINPIYSKVKSLDKEIKEKESAIKDGLRVLSQKDRIMSETAKYATFMSKSESEEEEITSILKEIEKLANKSSIYLIDMKPAGAKGTGSAKKIRREFEL